MRTLNLSAAALISLIALTACATAQEQALTASSCVAPAITTSENTISSGGTITLSGTAYFDGCADAIVVDKDGTQRKETVTPLENIEIRIQQGNQNLSLTEVSAGSDGTWSTELLVPEQLVPGQAAITAGTAEPVTITVN